MQSSLTKLVLFHFSITLFQHTKHITVVTETSTVVASSGSNVTHYTLTTRNLFSKLCHGLLKHPNPDSGYS
jgi:hypothetical protein